jgi:ABC-type multidrug transport system fused ATPase/permease subunit
MVLMERAFFLTVFLAALSLPSYTLAIEIAPRITDREIIESLTKLEEGQRRIEQSLRAEIRANAEAIRQLREDMNAQFGRMFYLILGLVGAFAAIVATTIGFAIWDRRTMIRPFETKVREIEEEISQNRQRLHSLIEALRSLSQTDEKVAEVLRRFNLF